MVFKVVSIEPGIGMQGNRAGDGDALCLGVQSPLGSRMLYILFCCLQSEDQTADNEEPDQQHALQEGQFVGEHGGRWWTIYRYAA